MKTRRILACVGGAGVSAWACLLAGAGPSPAGTAPPATPAATAPAAPTTWKLVWSDEFDVPGRPDPSKWGYEEGFIRNQEQQYYMKDRPENARVEDGKLVIECRKEHVKNASFEAGSKDENKRRESGEFTSASLNTHGKASWTYGKLEMRAKLPSGLGVWPAIWMLGDNFKKVGWPMCGEIDIMEFVGHDPEFVHGTAHFAMPQADGSPTIVRPKGDTSDPHRSNGSKTKAVPSPTADFHVYAVEWDAEHIDFLYDGVKYHRFTIDDAGKGADNPFRKPHYLLINFAWGGTWGGKIDESVLPQKFEVDYVRVYEKAK